MKTPKQDCEDLMNSVLPFAQRMLAEFREFLPFGGTMSVSGEIAAVGGWTDSEYPPSAEVIALLNDGFRDGAASKRYRATALAYDILVVPPGATKKQDAIAIKLDHADGYSVVVTFPYVFSAAGELLVSAPFATPGANAIFTR